jgi:mannose-6-phosphate isomerase-like protein (cupin superfamily)
LTAILCYPYLSPKDEREDAMRRAIWMRTMVVGFCALCASLASPAQQVDHYTPDSLIEQAKPLKEKAATADGAAAVTLQKYGVDYTMLSFRSKDGGAELHEKFADIFVIVEGSATLLSGGELDNPTTSAPGEVHGTSILHATTTSLSKGDVVHIPANTPHQLLLPKGATLTYFVIKVKEKE